MLAAFVLLALAHRDRSVIYLASAPLGTGIDLSLVAMANLIVATVPPDQTEVATGINTIVQTVGAAVGSQVAGTILASSVIAAVGQPSEDAFVAAFWLSSAVLAVGVVAALAVPVGRPAKPAGVANATPEPGVA
jgi:predicted MFS family arabinose efflux permease